MKKLLGIIVLGLLLSGCETTKPVSQQKVMVESKQIKIGMGWNEVRRLTNGGAWSTQFRSTKQFLYVKPNHPAIVPIYIFEQKDPEKQLKGLVSNLHNYELIHIFFNDIEYYKYLLNHELSNDLNYTKKYYMEQLKIALKEKKDLEKIDDELKKIEEGDSETQPKTTPEDSQEISGASGTAFFIDNNGHLITNHHVVKGCKDKSQISYNNKNIKAKLIAKDEFLDLALLKVDIENNNFINISDSSPKKLKRIIVAGYPFGLELSNDLKFNSGIITSIKGLGDDSTRIQIDAAVNPGNSGGPIVYEENGELVAVAVAGLSKDKTEAVNFGIKALTVDFNF